MNVGMWGRIVLRVGLVALSNSALASGGGEGGGGMGAIWPSIRPLGDLTLSPCLGEGPEPGVVISFDSDCITVVLIRDLRGACCFLASSALRATVPLNGRAATAVALCTCSVAMQQRNSAPTMLATDADKKVFFDALTNPPEPNKALREAAQTYQKQVVVK